MLGSGKEWVQVPAESDQDKHFDEYPDLGIEEWHKKHNLLR